LSLKFNGDLYKTGEQIMVPLCPISVAADCIAVLKNHIALPGEHKIKDDGADKAVRIKSLMNAVPASYKL